MENIRINAILIWFEIILKEKTGAAQHPGGFWNETMVNMLVLKGLVHPKI